MAVFGVVLWLLRRLHLVLHFMLYTCCFAGRKMRNFLKTVFRIPGTKLNLHYFSKFLEKNFYYYFIIFFSLFFGNLKVIFNVEKIILNDKNWKNNFFFEFFKFIFFLRILHREIPFIFDEQKKDEYHFSLKKFKEIFFGKKLFF